MTSPLLKTSDVFTPNTSSPKLSKVSRSELEEELQDYIEERGKYVFVHGATKLGKTTLVKGAVRELDLFFWFDAQNLRGGSKDLWSALASALRQPVEEAMSSSKSDKSKWSFISTLGFFTSNAAGEHTKGSNNEKTFAIDLAHEIPRVFEALIEDGKSVALVLDDFHFIEDEATRSEILQALKPVADKGVSIIIVTLPYRNNAAAITTSNLSGRTKTVKMPLWSISELSEIANTGFTELNVSATAQDVHLLATNSFGSPQIMQELCLQVCRKINHIRTKQEDHVTLQMPPNAADLFKLVSDETAKSWLHHIGRGLKTRGKKRKNYDLPDGPTVDGYALILHALRSLGPQPTTTINQLRTEIAKLRKVELQAVTSMNLEDKLRGMSMLAAVDMKEALKEVDEDAGPVQVSDIFEGGSTAKAVPQPVFEWLEDESAKPINILDPLLVFTLRWHWDDVRRAVAAEQT